MLGINEYFTTGSNTIGGVKRFLVFTPHKIDDAELASSLNFTETIKHEHITTTYLDNLIDKHIDDGTGSEFCVTFKEEFRNKYTDYEIRKVLCKYLSIHRIQYVLYPEYGESTHLHYHGLIWGRVLVLSELLKQCKKHFGRTNIRMVKNPAKYKEYIRKERDSIGTVDFLRLTLFKLDK